MLQYSIYSVISPEGCASILWKSADKAPVAAEAMSLTASKLKKLKLIDKVIKEPAGGAHRSPHEVAVRIRETIVAQIDYLASQPVETLLSERYQRLMAHGAFEQA
jgi:acetyl-CoA carboxylase carboxyl transferase subunit alpha